MLQNAICRKHPMHSTPVRARIFPGCCTASGSSIAEAVWLLSGRTSFVLKTLQGTSIKQLESQAGNRWGLQSAFQGKKTIQYAPDRSMDLAAEYCLASHTGDLSAVAS